MNFDRPPKGQFTLSRCLTVLKGSYLIKAWDRRAKKFWISSHKPHLYIFLMERQECCNAFLCLIWNSDLKAELWQLHSTQGCRQAFWMVSDTLTRGEKYRQKMTPVARRNVREVQGPASGTQVKRQYKMGRGAKPRKFCTIFRIMGIKMKHLIICKAFNGHLKTTFNLRFELIFCYTLIS